LRELESESTLLECIFVVDLRKKEGARGRDVEMRLRKKEREKGREVTDEGEKEKICRTQTKGRHMRFFFFYYL
jgi:hypothetical protein